VKYLGHKVHVKVGEKIEGTKNFRGKLIDYLDENGKKILIIDISGRAYRIPKDFVIKARLEYEF
jgi:ribosome maturation factor RimP